MAASGLAISGTSTSGPDVIATTSDGAVYSDGTSELGMAGQPLAAPIVGIAPSLGGGYALVARDGGVFALPPGSPFFGSMGGHHLNAPIVGIANDGGVSYWLVAADGGVFSFNGAPFYGSMGGHHLNAPIVGMAPTYDGAGYWLVAADGGVFAFGDALFHGSMGGQRLNAPIVGIAQVSNASFPTVTGYYLAGADGGIFAFGGAVFNESGVGLIQSPVVGIASTDIANPTWPPVWGAEIATSNGQLLRLY